MTTVLAGAFAVFTALAASAYETTFPADIFGPIGAQVAGKDGWTINDLGSDKNPLTAPHGLSYSNDLDSSLAAELGGYYDVPVASPPTTVFLSHAAAGELSTTTVRVDFLIQPGKPDYPGRDGFGFALRDAGNHNLFSVSLIPDAKNNAYQVRYAVGGNPPVSAVDGGNAQIMVTVSTVYKLSLEFSPAGANPTFRATLTGAHAKTFTGIATGLGAATVARFGAEWNVRNTVAGSNGLVMDNVAVVQTANKALGAAPGAAKVALTAAAGAAKTVRPTAPSVAIGGNPSACGGTAPYWYSWSPVTGLSSPTAANPAASPTATTTYTLTVTDSLGAVATDSVSVKHESIAR